MDAYIYNADIYCEECASDIRLDLPVPTYPEPWDTNDYPSGPYADGGGEADYPQHCGSCELFLENPLTKDGQDYVLRHVKDRLQLTIVQEWLAFYDYLEPNK